MVDCVEWTLNWKHFCGDPTGKIRVYCHPKYFDGLPNTLYHNRGDGTFENVTEKSGIGHYVSRGMSVAFEDYKTTTGSSMPLLPMTSCPISCFRTTETGPLTKWRS